MQCVDCGVTYRITRKCNRTRCKECYPKFVDRQRNNNYLNTYGIDLEDYNRMFAEQNGVCAACNLPESRIDPKTKKPQPLRVDHCHATGRVRGLLCSSCNIALGILKEDPARITGLLAYAERQREAAAKAQEFTRKQKPVKPPVVSRLKIRCYTFFGFDSWDGMQVKLFGQTIEDKAMTPEQRLTMHEYFETQKQLRAKSKSA